MEKTSSTLLTSTQPSENRFEITHIEITHIEITRLEITHHEITHFEILYLEITRLENTHLDIIHLERAHPRSYSKTCHLFAQHYLKMLAFFDFNNRQLQERSPMKYTGSQLRCESVAKYSELIF